MISVGISILSFGMYLSKKHMSSNLKKSEKKTEKNIKSNFSVIREKSKSFKYWKLAFRIFCLFVCIFFLCVKVGFCFANSSGQEITIFLFCIPSINVAQQVVQSFSSTFSNFLMGLGHCARKAKDAATLALGVSCTSLLS